MLSVKKSMYIRLHPFLTLLIQIISFSHFCFHKQTVVEVFSGWGRGGKGNSQVAVSPYEMLSSLSSSG